MGARWPPSVPSATRTSVRAVERAKLQGLLSEGLSLEQIAAFVGKDASTVAYWVRKHGLRAVHAERHASKGGIPAETLADLTQDGLSTREIGTRLGLSQGTVRHWLRRHGLKTRHQRPGARKKRRRGEDPDKQVMICQRHGSTEFWLEDRGIYRCLKCRSEAVSRRRRRVKQMLVAEAGRKCALCGYDRHVGALQFHHLESSQKLFGLADRGATRSLDAARAEAEKCVLLCSNCHAEVEAAMVKLP